MEYDMQSGSLLEGIWDGAVKTTQSRLSLEIKDLLKLMIPLQTVCLSASSAITCSRIIPEEIELLPALPLGDVVFEELSTDVPVGSMIVILKEQNCKAVASPSEVSFQLGLIIGDVLLGIIGEGAFPLQYETEALRVMANSYYSLIEKLELEQHKIRAASFHCGLSKSVSAYWNGPARNECGPCSACQYCKSEAELYGGYLKPDKPYIWMRGLNQKRVNLSAMYGRLYDCKTWKKDIISAVLGEILSDKNHVCNH